MLEIVTNLKTNRSEAVAIVSEGDIEAERLLLTPYMIEWALHEIGSEQTDRHWAVSFSDDGGCHFCWIGLKT